ncbi:MAG TPA: tRNA preQ1(34) S-adenosylmethionine ribosyltransferase-isomerase QueA [Burkholderiaceae bacterium]|nr:tRNA preQ1(34) S-adenosylmethionine ribosyltransferase-isomerase QueA [Burkholderiaceae bacterium]
MAGKAMQALDELTLDDFDFALPPELIAQHPLPERTASRLLHVAAEGLHDLAFTAIERLLFPGDLLVFNDTRVIKARLLGRKPTGGRVEALVERVLEPTLALAMVRTSHRPAYGTTFMFGDVRGTVEGRSDDFFLLRFDAEVETVMARLGHVPLPPYIAHPDDAEDAERYQTVYAAQPGAVAAPTAGLHFSRELLDRLQTRGVECATLTLHVGAGTFQPVRTRNLAEHRMHSEWFEISPAAAVAINAARAGRRRVVAVGTTSLRALESAGSDGAVRTGAGETRLFITPGYRFRVVDALLTNFHLPKSTLLMLVSAFAGLDTIRAAYAHAVAQRYRFFSYGDAMFLERRAAASL